MDDNAPVEMKDINSNNTLDDVQTTDVEYKSASVARIAIMDEYTKERERGGIIDNKAIGLITILLALVTVYIPIIPFEKFKNVYKTGDKNQLIMMTFIVLIFIMALSLAIITFTILIRIVDLKTYKRVDIDILTKDKFLSEDEDIYERALCRHYRKLIEQNSKVNDTKSKKISACYILTIVLFICLLLACIFIKIM
ncbi:hypothetical protein [Clostridium perfringens]|uniref:hypothetical protein n=1 Tax=Clostridium perfringens TaxID=1502 RepID=UPI001A247E68|nr:hypothetical protein CPBEC5_00600 [Clostridium perfringens]HAT4315837.1 hypothetical protein [Clostridium perfringens]HCG3019772.1 hypothetical protein [Clostridium perfringens]